MRSAEQIGRTVSEYRDWQAAQRQATLKALLAELRRSRGESWYIEGLATARAGFGETPYPKARKGATARVAPKRPGP